MELEDEGISEETIRANLEMFLPYICDCVQAKDLLVHLHAFTREQRKEIFNKSVVRKQEATKQALDIITHTWTDPGRFMELLEAVKEAGYPKVAKMLVGKHVPYDHNCRTIVDLFTPELTGRLKPIELLPLLRKYNVIGQSDSDEIRAEEENYGRSRASWLLLYYLPCREKNWFKHFLATLMRTTDFKDLAERLDPDLYEKLFIHQRECVDSSLASLQEESMSLVYDRLSIMDAHENVMSDHESVTLDDNVHAAPTRSSARSDASDENATVDKSKLEDFSNLELSEVKVLNVEAYEKQESGADTDVTALLAVLSKLDKFGETSEDDTVIEKDTLEDTKEVKDDFSLDFSSLVIPDEARSSEAAAAGPPKATGAESTQADRMDSPVGEDEPADEGSEGIQDTETEVKVIDSEETEVKVIDSEETEVKVIDSEETQVKTLDSFDDLLPDADDQTDRTEVKQVVHFATSAAAGDDDSDDDDFTKLLLDDLKAEKANDEHPNDLSTETGALVLEETEWNIKTDEDVLEDTEDRDVELRNYQRELAQAGCDGENVIVMAPTNSGKTRVSCAIMQAHMRRCKREGKIGRVIFIVENEALAGQQGIVCAEQLSAYRTKVISGSTQRDKQEYLKDFVDRRDILVVTAQVLVNALRDKEIENVCTFSMIVFDECHHTNSFHPYNQIMSKYMDLKLNKNNTLDLPQIIGLTASIGVGGNSNPDAAIRHMKKIMSNMDASFLCTVRVNVEELKRFEKPPIEETVMVDGRQHDIFRVTLDGCVERIRTLMATHPSMANLGERDKILKGVCTVPESCGSEQFMQWLSDFKKAIAELSSDAARRVMNPCRHHLEVYNKALMIHRDARVQEARKVLEVYMQDQIDENTVKDETDRKLLRIYERVQTIDYAGIPENPKLLKLEQLILNVLKNDPNARGIIFVKTRELARALIKWTRESPQLAPLKASEFVGQVASASEGGMTKSGQKDILEYFKGGRHKLVIATSVAEEGLDIAKCNLVIRYEHVTNEIVRLQSRGRARAESSQYYVLTETGSWIAAKEEKNALLEELMKQLVPVVQREIEENQNSWQRDMRDMQKEVKELEALKEKERLDKQAAGPCLIQCLNCSEFICMSTDVRQIQNAHHVVIEDDIKENVVTVRSPIPAFEESELKYDGCVFCRKCVYPLGGVCEYKNVEFPLLKVKQLRFQNQKGIGVTKKKWKDVPFFVEKFTLDDLRLVVERKLEEMENEY